MKKKSILLTLLFVAIIFIILQMILRIGNRKDSINQNGEKRTIYVQQLNQEKIYKSETGGQTWVDDAVPDVYMTIDTEKYTKKDDKITVKFVNNSGETLITSTAFQLSLWNEEKDRWEPSLTEDFVFADEGYYIEPEKTLTMDCTLTQTKIDAGRYLLTKEVCLSNDPLFTYSLSLELLITE